MVTYPTKHRLTAGAREDVLPLRLQRDRVQMQRIGQPLQVYVGVLWHRRGCVEHLKSLADLKAWELGLYSGAGQDTVGPHFAKASVNDICWNSSFEADAEGRAAELPHNLLLQKIHHRRRVTKNTEALLGVSEQRRDSGIEVVDLFVQDCWVDALTIQQPCQRHCLVCNIGHH